MFRLSVIHAGCALFSLCLFSSPLAAGSHAGPPSFFNSVAVPVDNTPYDLRWRQASRDPVPAGWSLISRARRDGSYQQLLEINEAVNRAITYREDLSGDIWLSGSEALKRGAGDCEDYAFAKRAALIATGFRPDQIFFIIGEDLVRRAPHAVLVVAAGGAEAWVLDNVRSAPVPVQSYRDFRPMITLSSSGRWVHGYDAVTHGSKLSGRTLPSGWGPASGGSALQAISQAQRFAQ